MNQPKAAPTKLQVALGALLCLFTLVEINLPHFEVQSQLAIFAGLGLVICYLYRPIHPKLRWLDAVLALASAITCGYVVVQNEAWGRALWINESTLGNRAGSEASIDYWVGAIGLILVLEATRRAIGWALPILAGLFILYAFIGPNLPDALFPHRGYGLERVVAQTFLHTQGIFGTALKVMFTYVFVFVLFGALLKETGATGAIIRFAQRVFAKSPGAPAKVSVLSSGLMGSLSGSAVANTATTGTFTIPMMRSSGFKKEIAAGVEAAASSGGALVPPVMGAGAYMMLELVDPPVTFLQIVQAALIPAALYYASLLLIVHLYSRRLGLDQPTEMPQDEGSLKPGLIFLFGFGVLIAMLLSGFTVFRSVTLAIFAVAASSWILPETRLDLTKLKNAVVGTARDVVPLVTAAACVGIVIGIVVLTGIGSKLPAAVLDVSQDNLPAALFLIMISSIVLGMGLPSAVCYLLMATLIGPVLGELGVVPLGAHLFIFYFGMMSMVTPPVALAAYTAGTLAGAGIMQTGLAAFRFALVGFTLPYMFVFRPELIMLQDDGSAAGIGPIAWAVVLALMGIVPLAASIAGYLLKPLNPVGRFILFVAAMALLIPTGDAVGGLGIGGAIGAALVAAVAGSQLVRAQGSR